MNRINRRRFALMSSSLPLASAFLEGKALSSEGGLTDISGLQVGHFTDSRRPTGCTVVLCPDGAVTGVDVRGSAPGTRETDLLDPVKMVQKVHAVVLSGGSAFGLDSASGVVRYLDEKGIGFPTGVANVPIVPAAVLFDLHLGDPKIRPDAEAGYRAAQAAGSGPIAEGCVGAGAGACAGLFFGLKRAVKSGIGSASIQVGDLRVAALVAVNCSGDVIDFEQGRILAGARKESGSGFENVLQWLRTHEVPTRGTWGENTTIGIVATNAGFDQARMTKVAQMAQAGLARAIVPAHMPFEGDTLFALSAGNLEADLGQIGSLAAHVVARAIMRAVLTAKTVLGVPSCSDLHVESQKADAP